MTERLKVITTRKLDQEFVDFLDGLRNRLSLVVTDQSKAYPMREHCFRQFMEITTRRREVIARLNK